MNRYFNWMKFDYLAMSRSSVSRVQNLIKSKRVCFHYLLNFSVIIDIENVFNSVNN